MPARGNVETLVTMQPIAVDTGSDDRDGMLVMANGMLVAVLVQLAMTDHEEAGDWFVEVALGRLGAHRTLTFGNLDDATRWIRRRLRA
ncbi:hypothetical protein [Methylobacterium sp. J-092]|uniref:hypothetical protein n=1 Tax=Methylobacterium sp. J-092 TaxID=2836667 RepID=UPI001FBACA57|nr:hypothetical protein [Methylobacterium sp. J-092]MCJ2009309.1 hypothetical protein [Methylobacterium sp. J-092]